jgi:hypothetical protein
VAAHSSLDLLRVDPRVLVALLEPHSDPAAVE